MKIGRYRRCSTFSPDDLGAVGYVWCGLPKNWIKIREDHIFADPPRPASTRSLNTLHRKQKNPIRRYAFYQGIHLWRVFSDVTGEHDTPLHNRHGLGGLIFHIKERGIQRILVSGAERLAVGVAERLVLLKFFRSCKVRVIDVCHPRELTSDLYLRRLAPRVSKEELAAARYALGILRRKASLSGTGATVGRKPFGTASKEEGLVLRRISELSRMLPKDQRKRGACRRSFEQIAEVLNEEKRPTRTGKPWTGSTVRGIIKRERPDLYHRWSGRQKSK